MRFAAAQANQRGAQSSMGSNTAAIKKIKENSSRSHEGALYRDTSESEILTQSDVPLVQVD